MARCKLEAIDRKIDGMTGEWLREYNNNKGPLTLSDIDTYPTPRLPPQELSVKVECESQTLGGSGSQRWSSFLEKSSRTTRTR